MSSLSAAINSACFVRRSICVPPSHKLQNGAFWCHQKKNKKQFSLCRALPFDLSPPAIDIDPLEAMSVYKVEVSEDGKTNTDASNEEALDAVDRGVAVMNLSDYGRIRVSGEDRIQFLHNQTTANFECLDEGKGCDTVFVTPTARTIDISHAWVMKTAIMLVVSPMTCGRITEMMKNKIMKDLGLGDLIGQPYGSHKHYSVGAMPLSVAVGSIISTEGFTFMISPAAAKSVWKALLGLGATPMSSNAWETLRVLRGRPAPGKELTDEFNVLEAGLWQAVSLNKEIVGKLTSFTAGTITSGPFGLGYVKRKAASQGDTVIVGNGIIGTLVEVPFLRDSTSTIKG
ncbi:hypothetical protein OROHE_018809 [Orobanche hederae]